MEEAWRYNKKKRGSKKKKEEEAWRYKNKKGKSKKKGELD